ncbi:hypothetical protein [Pontibacter indicus]|uniref:G/U mismatch-specific uracil-DNA glycosylase n=1 Tax=Pontibacter indicus TaxID=1317125 RepID=A0A1R3XGL7_9BACT|nr:hypothetical protein [Pontibacter indicus]SIT90518.1 hypothetical protein SAMN05444128_2312 [Pontibacter indicus]
MPIVHRFIDQLTEIEQNKTFCDRQIATNSNILIIGTFNPSDASCEKENTANWFYGRNQSKFWRYFPTALTGDSLHPNDGIDGHPQIWKKYCIDNDIVIIDLIKSININDILPNFGDREVNCKINHDLSNTEYFDIDLAFNGITFIKVIYSLTWTDNYIPRLKRIRDIINRKLLENNCIQNVNQIKYCLTPSRNDAQTSWTNAIVE